MTEKPFMPPEKTLAQKLDRETRRVGRQIAALVLPSWGHVARAAHDLRRHKTVRVTEGAQPLMDEVAVLLIYQRAGCWIRRCGSCAGWRRRACRSSW
ncbi:hypothetical protein [Paracoccus sp. PAMC 22219]|uniref:hypothetical protein n=1 Tax=Paracoccus sp. PAMC 22219 TaxID=1569209 RepID=UPI0005AB846F|nr:hypothetical protein [Paracoccus sp. PAMC 22219]